jgi:hypothetical protein
MIQGMTREMLDEVDEIKSAAAYDPDCTDRTISAVIELMLCGWDVDNFIKLRTELP